MTNAPEGRTYFKKQWVLDPDVASGKRPSQHVGYYTQDDYVVRETPLFIPNGKWVMERPSAPWGSWFVGTEVQIEHIVLDSLHGYPHILYVSDWPFGCVVALEDEPIVYGSKNPQGRGGYLNVARQVWKGELGRGIRTPTLDYVRQPFGPHEKLAMKPRERRRGQHGWIQLAHLGEVTVGYRPDDQVNLILGYWNFSSRRNFKDGGRLVGVAWGSSLDIKSGDAEVRYLTQEQFRKECSDTSEVWVPRGFVYTILRLQALGVQPEVLQTV